jgi:protein-S-isoprenylcysteine O-methyltransferase Ste14
MADNKKDKQQGIGMTVGGVILVVIAVGLFIGMYIVKDKNLPVIMFWVGAILLIAGFVLLFTYGIPALK